MPICTKKCNGNACKQCLPSTYGYIVIGTQTKLAGLVHGLVNIYTEYLMNIMHLIISLFEFSIVENFFFFLLYLYSYTNLNPYARNVLLNWFFCIVEM